MAICVAERQPADCCFPNALEAITALQAVIRFTDVAPKAHYYLGNLWYDKRQYTEAIGRMGEVGRTRRYVSDGSP